MRVPAISNNQGFNNPVKNQTTFGSIEITRTFGDVFGIVVKADKTPNLVTFSDRKAKIKNLAIGTSIYAQELSRMLKSLKERTANPELALKVRGLSSNVIDDMLPKFRETYEINGKKYNFSEINNAISNLRASALKGKIKCTKNHKRLNIKLDPNEEVSNGEKVNRKTLALRGLKQP